MKVAVFVINLESRWDRFAEFMGQRYLPKYEIEKFNACDGRSVDELVHPTPPNVAACWISHQEVSRHLLEKGIDIALVLEDDAIFSSKISRLPTIIEYFSKSNLDILQIGYLVHDGKVASGHFDFILRNKFYFQNLFNMRKLKNSFLLSRFSTMGVFEKSFEAGTHAYLIKPSGARIVDIFNNPVFLPADLALIELATSTNVHVGRLVKSIVSQSNSPSSIKDVTNAKFENGFNAWLGRIVD